jgi:hypothetical protein
MSRCNIDILFLGWRHGDGAGRPRHESGRAGGVPQHIVPGSEEDSCARPGRKRWASRRVLPAPPGIEGYARIPASTLGRRIPACRNEETCSDPGARRWRLPRAAIRPVTGAPRSGDEPCARGRGETPSALNFHAEQHRRGGEIGKRTRLKIAREQSLAGSSPAPGIHRAPTAYAVGALRSFWPEIGPTMP